MMRFARSKSMIIGTIMLVIVSIAGCGIAPVSVKYVPTGAHQRIILGFPKVKLRVQDVREKKIFFRTILGDNDDEGKNGVMRLIRTPTAVFEEGFIEALQSAGYEVRDDAEIVYEVRIKRFMVIDMQESPHLLDSDIVLEILVKRSDKVLARKIIFEKDAEKQGFGQVWQDTIPPLLSRSLSRAIETSISDPSIIVAIERANGLNTKFADVRTRVESATSKPSPIARKNSQTTPKGLKTAYDKNKASPFKARYVRGLGPPEVLIKNQSHKTITINLTGSDEYSFTLPPRESIQKTIIAGKYSYHASAIGVRSCSGTETFGKDHRYTWTFMIMSYPSLPNITIPSQW